MSDTYYRGEPVPLSEVPDWLLRVVSETFARKESNPSMDILGWSSAQVLLQREYPHLKPTNKTDELPSVLLLREWWNDAVSRLFIWMHSCKAAS